MIPTLLLMLPILMLETAYTVADAIMDSIDHHKAAAKLNDFWHIMKHLSRVLLLLIGGYLFFLYLNTSMLYIASLILTFYPLKRLVWLPIYRDYAYKWVKIDNNLSMSTGIKWLDKFLGMGNLK